MEQKLKEYRALKRRQALVDNTKRKIDSFLDWNKKIIMGEDSKEDEVLLIPDEDEIEADNVASDVESEEVEIEDVRQESWKFFALKWTLYVAVWLTMFIFFIKLEFGAIFFIVSLLVGICLNTRTKPKKKGEASAYSVFNKNCESIDGSLNADQFVRQMLYGPAGISTS